MKVAMLSVAFIILPILLLSSFSCQSDGTGKWEILTKQNFSSQIRLHPHILLLVSVPWSGESRSLMREISHLVTERPEMEFRFLKLMYLYRNKEKVLADAIGATEEQTILYYHHSLSYKYRGNYVATNVLSSILPYISASPGEIPLKPLNTPDELNLFLESTDRALLLFEFCGYAPKLLSLANKERNGTEYGDFGGVSSDQDSDAIPVSSGKENLKLQGTEGANLNCGIQDGFNGIPWVGEFCSENSSVFLHDTKDLEPSVGPSYCTSEGFQKFDSFFSAFMNVAREFFLPSERTRFGLVSERSLLLSLGIEDSSSWLTMLYFNGCPSCSKILKEGDDLKTILLMDGSVVTELEGNGQDLAVPANKPSMLLFVDRFSRSMETKRRSNEALAALRTLALESQISDQGTQQNGEKSERSFVQAFQGYRSMFGHPRLKLSPMAQKIKMKEKMSIMIVNEGKHAILENFASHSQGNSLQEVLTYLLQQNKEAKLSSVAKEVGFQLLSNDVNIELTDKLPLEPQTQPTEVSDEPTEGLDGTIVNTGKDPDRSPQPSTDINYPLQDDEQKKTHVAVARHLMSVEPDELGSGDGLVISGLKAAEEGSTQQDPFEEEQQLQFESFKGSFFFSEGNYRLLKALTGETRIPSLVIIDPLSHQHYVFTDEMVFSYSSLKDLLHRFLNGIVSPYQLSESELENPIEGIHPPFINTDFHEANSIPRVTSRGFSELVLGLNQSNDDAANAWKEDVLVLFTNSWCGFCQRMELVVREAYQAIKGYCNMLKTGPGAAETMHNGDNIKFDLLKFPKIYLMDCALNDCSFILKSKHQRDVYPSLLLFPAERKAAVPYDGDMAVDDVVKFIADHGSNSQHLTNEKAEEVLKDAPLEKDKSHEVLLKNWIPKGHREHSQIQSHGAVVSVTVGSILAATEKISTQPFDKSLVLIVKADQSTGFQGLIYNKLIRWDSLDEADRQLEELLKEAPLSFGGPLVKRGMPFVALTRREVSDQFPEVVPGIHFLDQAATLIDIEELKAGNRSIYDYWFFLGYSSWGRNQLFDEIAEGAWFLSVNKTEHLDWPSN